MKKRPFIQYSVRGVPREVDRALRQKVADFSDIPGRWAKDPAFDKIIASQRKIDWEKWKRGAETCPAKNS